MKNSPIYDKSKSFAIAIVQLTDELFARRIYSLSDQLLRSGTSIGANIRESYRAQSIPDFISKMNIALKESEETAYWLELLYETNKIDKNTYETHIAILDEIIKMLVSIINTTKQNKQ